MDMNELPLKVMQIHISNPRQQLLDRLVELDITDHILNQYAGLEDRAEAFDGAFTATQIELHMQSGADPAEYIDEATGWYDTFGHTLTGPFFNGLRETLTRMELRDFYRDMVTFLKNERPD